MKTSFLPPTVRLDLTGSSGPSARASGQLSFEDLGTTLAETTFVVVDLETTGGQASGDGITEIGAVKLRGGEIVGEFQSFVNPGCAIPASISVLTGITTAMVASAPAIDSVLPAFLEFAGFPGGAVLVAHNARFDVGFLKAACSALGFPWPTPLVVDTLALARRALAADEVRNFKLGTLAAAFGTETAPDHRALSDARATAEILHILMERLAPLGLTHREDLRTISDRVPAARRKKSSMADTVPRGPGVYQFLGPDERVLYVGTATDLRSRVKSYFTAAEKRQRIAEMLDIAVSVRTLPCASTIESRVREIRLIAELQPPYNIRSRRAMSLPWVRLTTEPYPRPTITRTLSLADMAEAWGPFASRAQAQLAVRALTETFQLRTCADRLPASPRQGARACIAAELGLCAAPCTRESAASGYGRNVRRARAALRGDVAETIRFLEARIGRLAEQTRYEEAAEARECLRAVLSGSQRAETLRIFTGQSHVVGAARRGSGWDIVVARHGRLAGCYRMSRGEDAVRAVELAVASAEFVPPAQTVSESAAAEETALLADWFWREGTRLIEVHDGAEPLALPLTSAARFPLPPTG